MLPQTLCFSLSLPLSPTHSLSLSHTHTHIQILLRKEWNNNSAEFVGNCVWLSVSNSEHSFVHMYIGTYLHAYTYVTECIFKCTWICTYVCVLYICTCSMKIHIYLNIYICMCFIHMCLYHAYSYLCTWICTWMHIHNCLILPYPFRRVRKLKCHWYRFLMSTFFTRHPIKSSYCSQAFLK
jgi:hypothetical protein